MKRLILILLLLLIMEVRVNMLKKYLILLVLVCAFSATSLRRAEACFCVACDCATASSLHEATIENINNYIEQRFEWLVETFINETLVEDIWWPALRKFAEQVTISSQKATLEIGSTLSDARQTHAALLLIQEKKVDAAEEVQPDEETCKYASMAQSFAASDAKTKNARNLFTQQGINRSMGMAGGMAASGPDEDRLARFQAASSRYIDALEMGGALSAYSTIPDDTRISADITLSTLTGKGTLDIDKSSPVITNDAEDIYALKTNLYNSRTLTRLTPNDLVNYGTYDDFDDMQGLAAMQAIAEYSFDAIAALKVNGDSTSGSVMRAVLSEMQMTPQGIDHLIGAGDTPSYLQQLRVLSKTIQSAPDSHIKQVSGSTEIMRQLAIKEAIELMVKFEIYKSLQRSTTITASLHELERRDLQSEWEAQPIFMEIGR